MTNQGGTQALWATDKLEAPTDTITQPAIVDCIVGARHKAHDFIDAHIYTSIAADATVVANARYAFQLPWPRLEAVSRSRERTHRAHLHCIAGEDRVKGVIGRGADFHFIAT